VVLKPALKAVNRAGRPTVGFIGAGNYATGVLIPAFVKTKARLKSVASSGGVSGVHAGRKHGFEETTTDTAGLIRDPEINTVVITTRHDSHARFVCEALRAGKHVFVEKPLALNREHLSQIQEVYEPLAEQGRAPRLMVGLNRRFSPLIQKARTLLAGVAGPKTFVMTINAGEIPADHWT
jgi:predicted dehydrogenase